MRRDQLAAGVPALGSGLRHEAGRAALRVGVETIGLPEIVSFKPVRNVRSHAVMTRLGMRDTGETFEHSGSPAGDPRRGHCLYRLARVTGPAARREARFWLAGQAR